MEIERRVAKWPFKILHRDDPKKDHYFSCNSESEMKVAKLSIGCRPGCLIVASSNWSGNCSVV